jgi:RNA polymerase sigma-70 factor (ECF subfamily)
LSSEFDTLEMTAPGPSFAEFLARVRAGDESAALDLVRRYEPALRMEVRLRMGDPRLRQLLEPADICQSVLGSFFVRVASGQFDLDGPNQLLALLLTMARNKVAQQARRQLALRRDVRRGIPLDEKTMELVSDEPSPVRVIIGRDLLAEFQRRLSDEERLLSRMRADGLEWADIAAEVGGTPQARRKQLSRAVDRVSRELGLVEVGDA